MQLLTNSRRRCFNKCPKLYYYSYEQGYRPVVTDEALKFGSLFHGALEHYWKDSFDAANNWLNNQDSTEYNAFDIITAQCLLAGYHAKWFENQGDFKPALPEVEFRAPLINPLTMGVSKTFELAGKIDAVLPTKKQIVEHKTTSMDISTESDYWLNLTIDGQISGYYAGALSMGHNIESCLYDVIRKPALRRLLATPEENRKYKKDGTLYASQRIDDETLEQYRNRLSDEIALNPDKYYQRRIINRLEDDMAEYMTDMWGCAREIREAQLANRWPRNPQQCLSFGKCNFFGVCTKTEDIEDKSLFFKLDNPDQELPKAAKIIKQINN